MSNLNTNQNQINTMIQSKLNMLMQCSGDMINTYINEFNGSTDFKCDLEKWTSTQSAQDLRKLIRKLNEPRGWAIPSTDVVVLTRSECEKLLLNNEIPERCKKEKETNPFLHAPIGIEPKQEEKEIVIDKPVHAHEPSSKSKPDASMLLKQAIEALEIENKSSTLDSDAVRVLIQEELAKQEPVVYKTLIEIKQGKETIQHDELEHSMFPIVLKILGIPSLNLGLTGPAGSGKTACLMHAAKALKLAYYLQPMNIMSTKSDILGYMDASGRYVESAFYKAFKNGGLFIADEFDCCHAGVATLFNAAVANRCLTFGNNETVEAHKDFRCCICMNTIGQGATMQYVGRNALDAATLDRFVILHFGYDKALEKSMLGIKTTQKYEDVKKGGDCAAEEFLSFIDQTRKDIESNKFKSIVSPRASLYARLMMESGIGLYWILQGLIVKTMTKEQADKVFFASSIAGVKVLSLLK